MSLYKYQLRQDKTGPMCRFSLNVSDSETYHVELPFSIKRFEAKFNLNGEEQFRFKFDMNEAIRVRTDGIGEHKSVLLAIEDKNGDTLGNIYTCYSKKWLGYRFFASHFLGSEFTAYEVGLGKQEICVPVYCGSQQIAEIRKSPEVINNKDIYDLYLKNNNYLIPVMMLALYYDLIRFGNNSEISVGRQVTYVTTKNKEILEKYDPDFIKNA